jgi:hypothetical protein
MLKSIILLAHVFFICACSTPPPQKSFRYSASNHSTAKTVNTVSSELGNQLIGEINAGKYQNLKSYWIAQKENFCGVCSAVIVLNTARKNNNLTQDNIFSKKTNEIILPETIAKMGLTLRELEEILKTKAPELNPKKFPAHTSGLDLFKKHLRENNKNKSFMITNFSRQSIAGVGMAQGHFSIIAAYHEKKRQVLILEVNGAKESFWISDKDLFTAMSAIDPVSQIPRGWIITGK